MLPGFSAATSLVNMQQSVTDHHFVFYCRLHRREQHSFSISKPPFEKAIFQMAVVVKSYC
jgi:hypothetical protein